MKTKHNWFKNLLSHKTSRPSELTPPPGSPKTSEEMRSEEALFAVVKEFDKAVVKHPFFAHRPMRNYPVGYAQDMLDLERKFLASNIKDGDVPGCSVLECELAEAQEAYSRGDYAHCYQELAQVGAVVLRMMLGVQKKLQELEAPVDTLGPHGNMKNYTFLMVDIADKIRNEYEPRGAGYSYKIALSSTLYVAVMNWLFSMCNHDLDPRDPKPAEAEFCGYNVVVDDRLLGSTWGILQIDVRQRELVCVCSEPASPIL